jgi:FkbM family methyltransferase
VIRLNVKILLAALRTYIRNIKGRKFEPEIIFLKYMLNQDHNCFHIGASDARHSFVMSKLIGNGRIYAFEPSSYSYAHLVLMTKLHRLKNVQTYNMAVSDMAGTVCLVTPEKSTGHAGRSFAYITGLNASSRNRTDIKSSSSSAEEVKSVSIDDFVSENNLETVDFIRCDTEGSEMLILKGAIKTIEKNRPNLLVEIHSDALKNVFNSSASEVTNFLFGFGYHMFREDGGKIHQVNEVDETEKWKDYFFIHPDRVKDLPEGPFRNQLN